MGSAFPCFQRPVECCYSPGYYRTPATPGLFSGGAEGRQRRPEKLGGLALRTEDEGGLAIAFGQVQGVLLADAQDQDALLRRPLAVRPHPLAAIDWPTRAGRLF